MRHGSHLDPPNRFESIHREPDWEHLEWDQEYLQGKSHRKIEIIEDASQSIISENTSPDVPFRYSLNPYRGCIHACAYCYARPTHEFLGFNAGLDFETKIVVKRNAAALFREFLNRKSWQVEPITFSGVTDCYQPLERELQLTRQLLEVAMAYRQPVSIVTKNALVLRDLKLLQELAREQLVHVFLSITTLNAELARNMEPRTSTPAARLRAIEQLAAAKIPTGVLVAPIIPGLNDSEIPGILQQAKQAGASAAGYVLLRLPQTVGPVFEEWLNRVRPNEAEKVMGRIRSTRSGKVNDSLFGQRMVGSGQLADQIQTMFRLFRDKLGLLKRLPPHNRELFSAPATQTGQQMLF